MQNMFQSLKNAEYFNFTGLSLVKIFFQFNILSKKGMFQSSVSLFD